MKMSIVIPTHNRKELLRRCLAAATSQDCGDYEVIVVDDASTDGTGEMVRAEYPQVRYLRQEKNRGPAAARNRGIAVAAGEIIVFTDDDCLLPADFLSQLLTGYDRFPEVAGVGGYLEPPRGILLHNGFAQYESYNTHKHYNAGPEPYLGGFECPAGGTNSMSYRRDVLEAAGGFDESFPVAGGEDTDLKRRVVDSGRLLLYVPAEVTHLQSYTLRGFWRQYRNHGRGAVHYEMKHRHRPPSTGRLLLRGCARVARWLPDVVRLGPPMATYKLLAQLADLAGSWQEVFNLRRRRKGS